MYQIDIVLLGHLHFFFNPYVNFLFCFNNFSNLSLNVQGYCSDGKDLLVNSNSLTAVVVKSAIFKVVNAVLIEVVLQGLNLNGKKPYDLGKKYSDTFSCLFHY